MSYDLAQYLSDYMVDSPELQAIMDAENYIFDDILHAEAARLKSNQFITTADEDGLTLFEHIVRITADPQRESKEFRRQRLLNRYAMTPPFTMSFLRQRMDSIIGVGKYTLAMDYPNHILTLESSAIDQLWYEEVALTIHGVKPATVIFKNKPLMKDSVKLSEIIKATKQIYNYRAGTTAKTSLTVPIANRQDIGIIKGAEVMSITPAMLQYLAAHVLTLTDSVIVNDTYETDVFVTKSATDGVSTIEFTVPQSADIDVISKVNFRATNEDHLTNNTVYVPTNGEDVTLKHTIPFVEGGV